MVKLTFLSHSAWMVETDKTKILIDPFLEGNPMAKNKPEEISADYIIVTHAHGDHLGDALFPGQQRLRRGDAAGQDQRALRRAAGARHDRGRGGPLR